MKGHKLLRTCPVGSRDTQETWRPKAGGTGGPRVGWGARAPGTGAHSLKQWAADTSHRAPMTVAPQKCSLFSRRLTCQGNSPGDASTPPTILPAVLQPGCHPQSARQVTNQDPREAGLGRAPGTPLSSPRPPRGRTGSGSHTRLFCANWARGHGPRPGQAGGLTTVGLVGSIGAVHAVITLGVHFGHTLAVPAGEGIPRTVSCGQRRTEFLTSLRPSPLQRDPTSRPERPAWTTSPVPFSSLRAYEMIF